MFFMAIVTFNSLLSLSVFELVLHKRSSTGVSLTKLGTDDAYFFFVSALSPHTILLTSLYGGGKKRSGGFFLSKKCCKCVNRRIIGNHVAFTSATACLPSQVGHLSKGQLRKKGRSLDTFTPIVGADAILNHIF